MNKDDMNKKSIIYNYTSPAFTESYMDPDDPYKMRRLIDPVKFPPREPLTDEDLERISPKQDVSSQEEL